MMLSLLLLVALAAPAEAQHCSFDHPPAWPSFTFQALDRDGLKHFGDADVTPPEDGVIVLDWLGTSMPGQPIRVWVYTRPDKSIVHSRLLHADALERLYGEVMAWLKEHAPGKPEPEAKPGLRVSR